MSEQIFVVNLDDFEEKVIQASQHKPILVDLWAEWCSPCRVIAPILVQLAEEMDGEIGIAKIEVDEGDNMKIAGRYQVKGFPTLILFQHGEELARFSGAKPLSFIRDFIEQHAELL
ncbi:MAG TPA: thioredoxin [Gammaproteobacteria bacterium]